MKFGEGLEILGVDEYLNNNNTCCGLFEQSGVKHVGLPSTLKKIEYSAFKDCKNLKNIVLPGRLEYIGT